MGEDKQDSGTSEPARIKHKGRWFEYDNGELTCALCHHRCRLENGSSGVCGVRFGSDRGVSLPAWGRITAEALDPIEKKPLYHFYPGADVWSAGFAGCNLNCPFCQNFRIARAPATAGSFVDPKTLIRHTRESGAGILAFTYSEPTVHIEYLIEAAAEAKDKGIATVLVSNGCIDVAPAKELLDLIDGANIDLKSWNLDYYRRVLKGDLPMVRRFIETAVERCWLELTTLVVPGDNDGDKEMESMTEWIAGLSPDIPLHLSAYHPTYKYDRAPTPPRTLEGLAKLARERLAFVYVGNLGIDNDTLCPHCGYPVVKRRFYSTVSKIDKGKCPECFNTIPGVFN